MRYIDDLVNIITEHLPSDVKIETVQYIGDTRVTMSVSKDINIDALDGTVIALDKFENNDLRADVCDGIVNDFAKNLNDELSKLNLEKEEFSVSPFGFGGGVHLDFVDGDDFICSSDLKVLAEILIYDPAEILNPGEPDQAPTFSANDLDAAADPVTVSDAAPVAVDDVDEDEYIADHDVEEPVSEDIDFKALAEKYLGPDDEDEIADPTNKIYTKPMSDDEVEAALAQYYDENSGIRFDDDPWEDTLDYTNVKPHQGNSVHEAFEIYDCFNDTKFSGDHEGDCLDMISAEPAEGYVDPKSGEPCNRVEPSDESAEPVHIVDTARGQEIEKAAKKSALKEKD